MARKYESIWTAIKAVDVGKEVGVKCHATAVTTLIHAVEKEKSRETAIRKKLGLRYAGKMRERTEEAQPSGYVIVFFKLEFDGTRI